MANLIQATVYQIDGSPLASPITVDFPVNDIIVRKDNTLNIPAVNSAIQLYSATLNQISYKTYYVSQTVTTLVNLANDTITSFVKVNVLEINGDPVFGGIDYGFPSNQIAVNAAVNPTTGVNATITYRNNTYSVSQTQASILSSSSGYAGVVLNQLDVPSFRSDILANIPAPGQIGRMFVSTDTYALYRDSGVSWDLIGGPGTGTVTGSGSAGQVSFWSGASTIVGNSNLYWDNANVRLGIGTSSPAQQLDLTGSARIQTIANATIDTDRFLVSDSGVIKYRTGSEILSDIGGVGGSGTTNYVPKFTSSSAIGNSIIYESSGNIGINTTTPSTVVGYTALHINNNTFGSRLQFSIFSTEGLRITNENSISNITELRNVPITFGTNNTERMRLFSNGNFAIGTTTDAGYKLDVSGNIRSNNGLWVTNTLNPAVGVMTWGAFGGTNIQIGSWSLNTPVYFVLGSSPRMRLGGIAAGDVGQLTVGNVSNSDAAWVSTSYLLALGVSASLENNNEGSTFYSYNAYRSAGGLRYIASNPALSFGLDFNKFVWRSAASGTSGNLITFTESMTLDINGRLGIGTSNPQTQLDIANGLMFGTIDAFPSATYDAAAVIAKTGSLGSAPFNNAGSIVYRARVTSTAGRSSHIFYTGSPSTERMRLDESGRLGIGTTTPNQRLTVGVAHIANTVMPVLKLTTTGAYSGAGSSDAGASVEFGQYHDTYPNWVLGQISAIRSGASWDGALLFYTNNGTAETNKTERMRITSGGDVGIGTTSPARKLEVLSSGAIPARVSTTNSNMAIEYISTAGTRYNWLAGAQYNVSGAFEITPSTAVGGTTFSTPAFVVTSGGDVGIGTTTPGTKLEVNGAIKTAAPSGGTAKPFKIGAAATVTPTSQNRTIEIEIDGTTYYLTAKTTND